MKYTHELSHVGLFKVPPVKKTSSPILVLALASRTLFSELELSWCGKVSLRSTTSQWVVISNSVSALVLFSWNSVWLIGGRSAVGSAPNTTLEMGKYGLYVICVLFVVTKQIAWEFLVFVINAELHFITFDTVHLFKKYFSCWSWSYFSLFSGQLRCKVKSKPFHKNTLWN